MRFLKGLVLTTENRGPTALWDGKAGADYAGNSKGCSRGKKLVGVSSEAWAVVGWKSADETV